MSSMTIVSGNCQKGEHSTMRCLRIVRNLIESDSSGQGANDFFLNLVEPHQGKNAKKSVNRG